MSASASRSAYGPLHSPTDAKRCSYLSGAMSSKYSRSRFRRLEVDRGSSGLLGKRMEDKPTGHRTLRSQGVVSSQYFDSYTTHP